ncbi:MAG: type 1 glutamine amidotransferase [Pirellulales bacterium]
MRVHYLQHVAFEGLGSIEPWLRAAGHEITSTRLFAGESLPAPDQVDWLIVLGGPMGANDDATLPWLGPEKQFLRQVIGERKPVLGICLARSSLRPCWGRKFIKTAQREIGWWEIRRSADAATHALGNIFPQTADAFHWHGDTFDLPAGAVRLAESDACRNQAFAWADNVLALQFHLETTPQVAAALVENCRDELTDGPFIQTAEQMLARPERFEPLNRLMSGVLQAISNVKQSSNDARAATAPR